MTRTKRATRKKTGARTARRRPIKRDARSITRELTKMTDLEKAKKAANEAQKAREAAQTALSEMDTAGTQNKLKVAFDKVQANVKEARDQAVNALDATIATNTADVIDFLDKARDSAADAHKDGVIAQDLFVTKAPTLP